MTRRRRPSQTEGGPSLAGALAAAVIGLVLLAGVSELALRLLMPHWREFYSGWFMTSIAVPGQPDVTVGIKGFDGYFAQNNGDFRSHIHINDFNLRDDEPVEAADGRLWVIGDSMSFGWGVESDEMYSSRLAGLLKVPTYNVAGPGSNVCGWQALYARMPESVRPRLVVVGLTVENRIGLFDCKAEAQAAALTASQKTAAPVTVSGDPLSRPMVKRWLTEHSALYNFFAVSLKRIDLVERTLIRLGVVESADSLSMHGHKVEQAAAMVRSTADQLAALRAMIPAEIPMVVAVFPARPELQDGNAYYRDLRTGIEQALAERSIPAIDMLEPFAQVGFRPTHFAHDGHWTAEGHRVAAETIAAWLGAHGLVTVPQPN